MAGAALLALFTATTLAVFKPRGMTPYGQRKRLDSPAQTTTRNAPLVRE
jgi:hypothetical protein